MARGTEAKAARKQSRKEARAKAAEAILNGDENVNEFSSMPTFEDENDKSNNDDSDSDSDDDNVGGVTPEETPEKAVKKTSKSSRAKKAAKRTAAAKERGTGDAAGPSCCAPPGGGGQGIKTLPLIMLILLTGTTVLPAVLYASDYLGAFVQKNHIMGNLGHRLGIGPSPKKRVNSFYEKHDPEKIGEVPSILSKYYGDYPKLTKRLERKYNDYGYFVNWEQDEAPMYLAMDKLYETRDEIQKQFDRHAPAIVKTGARNMRSNLTQVYKKSYKVWKKQIWPVLEPYFGVPDAKAAKQQKLKDKKEANKRKGAATGTRRKSAEFRDDVDE